MKEDGAWDVVLTADGAERLGACAEALERWRSGEFPPYLDAEGLVDAFDPDFCVACWLWNVSDALRADGRAPWPFETGPLFCACVDPYGERTVARRKPLIEAVASMLAHVTTHRWVAIEALASLRW